MKTFLLLHLLPFLLSVPEPDTQIHFYLPQKSEEGTKLFSCCFFLICFFKGGTLDNGGGADYGAIANANAIAISNANANAIANAYGGVVDKVAIFLFAFAFAIFLFAFALLLFFGFFSFCFFLQRGNARQWWRGD